MPSEAHVNSDSGIVFIYLGIVREKLCLSIPRYSGTSELDTSVRCLANSCAIHGEFEGFGLHSTYPLSELTRVDCMLTDRKEKQMPCKGVNSFAIYY